MNEELEKRLAELEKRIADLESKPKAGPEWVHISRIVGYSKKDGKRSLDFDLCCST